MGEVEIVAKKQQIPYSPAAMANNDTKTEVIPRRTIRGSKSDHDALLDEIRSHVEVPDDYHPVLAVAIIANNPRMPVNLQMKGHEFVASYLFRKLKPAEAPAANAGEIPAARLIIEEAPEGMAPNVIRNVDEDGNIIDDA